MTTLTPRAERVLDDEFRLDLETLAVTTHPALGSIAPGEPTYLIADNAWSPWLRRAGGSAMGAWSASIVSLLLASPYLMWAVATSIAMTLLFAFVVAGHELREKHPTKFKQVP